MDQPEIFGTENKLMTFVVQSIAAVRLIVEKLQNDSDILKQAQNECNEKFRDLSCANRWMWATTEKTLEIAAKYTNISLPSHPFIPGSSTTRIFYASNEPKNKDLKWELSKIQDLLFSDGIVFFIPFRSPELADCASVTVENNSQKRNFHIKNPSNNEENSVSLFNQDTMAEMREIIEFAQEKLKAVSLPSWNSQVFVVDPNQQLHSMDAIKRYIGALDNFNSYPQNTTIVFYYTGHGDDEEGALCLYGSTIKSGNTQYAEFKFSDFEDIFCQNSISHRTNVMLILDSCYSGHWPVKLKQAYESGKFVGCKLCIQAVASRDEEAWTKCFTPRWIQSQLTTDISWNDHKQQPSYYHTRDWNSKLVFPIGNNLNS